VREESGHGSLKNSSICWGKEGDFNTGIYVNTRKSLKVNEMCKTLNLLHFMCTTIAMPGVNPSTVSYNASAVKFTTPKIA
jgi:hypothetical protein